MSLVTSIILTDTSAANLQVKIDAELINPASNLLNAAQVIYDSTDVEFWFATIIKTEL